MTGDFVSKTSYLLPVLTTLLVDQTSVQCWPWVALFMESNTSPDCTDIQSIGDTKSAIGANISFIVISDHDKFAIPLQHTPKSARYGGGRQYNAAVGFPDTRPETLKHPLQKRHHTKVCAKNAITSLKLSHPYL